MSYFELMSPGKLASMITTGSERAYSGARSNMSGSARTWGHLGAMNGNETWHQGAVGQCCGVHPVRKVVICVSVLKRSLIGALIPFPRRANPTSCVSVCRFA